MKQNSKFYLFAFLVLFLVGIVGFATNVHAQSTESEPIVQTNKTDTGSSVVITFPEGYSGSVTTSFDGKEYKTVTKKYTPEELKQMNEKMVETMRARQKAMQDFFEAQQKLFDEMWKQFDFSF